MGWWVIMQVLSTLIEWIRIGRLSEQEKDLETLVLRKQLAMVEQQLEKPVRLSRAERPSPALSPVPAAEPVDVGQDVHSVDLLNIKCI